MSILYTSTKKFSTVLLFLLYEFCHTQKTYKRKSRTVDISLDIFTSEDGKYQRHSESFSERAYTLEEITKWLGETGFEVKNIYNDMTSDSPDEESQRVYFTAVKR